MVLPAAQSAAFRMQAGRMLESVRHYAVLRHYAPLIPAFRAPVGQALPVAVSRHYHTTRRKEHGMTSSSKALRTTPARLGGFTLIELMVVVAVVAILGAVAYPSYRNYIVRGNRSAAQSFMLEVASKQERYMLDARTYAADMATLGMAVPSNVSSNYTVTTAPVVGPPPGYTVTAVPTGRQATEDAQCGTLGVDAAMNKTASGSGGLSFCWKQ
jgi:type IV pilus assembly protein PilE